MDTGERELSEMLESSGLPDTPGRAKNKSWSSEVPTGSDSEQKKVEGSYVQWASIGNGKFAPIGATQAKLEAGVYEPFSVSSAYGLNRLNIVSDGIYTLPDMATGVVLDEVKKFWNSEAAYRRHNLLYKRGILTWGPPGSGKTVTIKLLMQELIKRDGIVVVAHNIPLTTWVLRAFRAIEPSRNLIVVLEDIDEIIAVNGENTVLSLLDGEDNVDNVLFLATTNYPERLGPRILNRPSRFDRRIKIGMPGPEARAVYLQKATSDGLDKATLDKWVNDTDKLSIAHLRELVAAVYCLDQPYDEVMDRLNLMRKKVKGESGMIDGDAQVGFKSAGQETVN